MDDTIPRSILLLILILVSALFSAAETAYSYSNAVRAKLLAEEGNRNAGRVSWILERFDRTVVTLLIAINILRVIAASVATMMAVEHWGEIGSVIATVVLTIVVFLFAENIPKNIARVNADQISMAFSLPMVGFIYLLWPLATVFMWIGSRFKIEQTEPSMTEDEFTELVEGVEDEGLIENSEKEIIKSAIEFGDLRATDIMTPIDSVCAIPAGIQIQDLKRILLTEKYSRYPVFGGNTDQILGILHAKACLWQLNRGGPFKLRDAMSKAYFVSPDTPAEEVFRGMGKRRCHLAVVRSPEAKTLGVLSMEDILEEIVGEIYDEDDEMTPEEREAIRRETEEDEAASAAMADDTEGGSSV